jgi:hypothetical protein
VLPLVPVSTPVFVSSLATGPALPWGAEGEERAPVQDDEESEGGQSAKPGGTEKEARLLRQRRHAWCPVVPHSWTAHLPHPHAGTAGFSPPVCTPFEWGARLPLRC